MTTVRHPAGAHATRRLSWRAAAQAVCLALGPLLSAGASAGHAAGTVMLDSVSPKTGPARTTIEIEGFGFTAENTVHIGAIAIPHVAVSRAIGLACAPNASTCRAGIHQWLEVTVPDLGPGAHDVWVETQDAAKTPTLTFTVTR